MRPVWCPYGYISVQTQTNATPFGVSRIHNAHQTHRCQAYNCRMGNYGDQFNSAIAGELRAQRARISMTIEQVVERSGISKSAVLYYLNEKRQIPMPAFYELCAALEADPAELFMAAQKKVQEL